MLPLAAMLDSGDPEQFKAAACAIAELANPGNKAFQVGRALSCCSLMSHGMRRPNPIYAPCCMSERHTSLDFML